MSIGQLAILALVLSACGKVPPIEEDDLAPRSLAEVPQWSADIAGTQIGAVVGTGGTVDTCVGFVDVSSLVGEPAELRIEGWAWNTAASKPYEAVLVSDGSNAVVGAGTVSIRRGDVQAALPQTVKDDRVGYVAFSDPTEGERAVYGWDQANDTVCLVGRK